jgi:hypothetical protein
MTLCLLHLRRFGEISIFLFRINGEWLQSIETLRRYFQSVAQSGKLTPALAPGAGGENQCHCYRDRSDSMDTSDRHPANGHFCQRCQSYGKNARGALLSAYSLTKNNMK